MWTLFSLSCVLFFGFNSFHLNFCFFFVLFLFVSFFVLLDGTQTKFSMAKTVHGCIIVERETLRSNGQHARKLVSRCTLSTTVTCEIKNAHTYQSSGSSIICSCCVEYCDSTNGVTGMCVLECIVFLISTMYHQIYLYILSNLTYI